MRTCVIIEINDKMKNANILGKLCCLMTVSFWGGMSGLADDGNHISIAETRGAGAEAETFAAITNMTFNIDLRDASAEYLLDGLLACMNASNHVADIELRIRDARPVAEPVARVMGSKELLRIYNSPEDERAKGNFSINTRSTSLSSALEFAAYANDWEMMRHEIVENDGRLEIILGARELMEPGEYQRRTYEIQQKYREALGATGIPETLCPRDYFAIAFDRDAGILVILDDKDSLLFVFAEALSGNAAASPRNRDKDEIRFHERWNMGNWQGCSLSPPITMNGWTGWDVDWQGVSVEYVFGAFLAKLQAARPDRKIEAVLHKRDVSPSMENRIESIGAEELLGIFNNPESPKAKGDITWKIENASLHAALWNVYIKTGILPIDFSEKANGDIQVKAGPAEVLYPESHLRKTYQIPEEKLAFFREAGFPEELDPTASIAAAFDNDSGVLAIIALKNSPMFKFAEVFCRRDESIE